MKKHYQDLCRKYDIETQQCILQAINDNNGILDLSKETLSVGSCAVLGKIFQMTKAISKVSFEDCLLEEDAVKSLLLGLCGNTAITTASLKGNNIKGSGTLALAKMISTNSTLSKLSLEWNNLGLDVASFSSFCDALATNSCLQYIDLRSNQIESEAARYLSSALIRNCRLTAVDLRWNNLGSKGGNLIQEGLRHNRTLIKMELAGNHLPTELLNAIECQLEQNAHLASISGKFTMRTDQLQQMLERQDFESKLHIQHNDASMKESAKDRMFVQGQLEEQLHCRELELRNVKAKLDFASSAVAMLKGRMEGMEKEVEEERCRAREAEEEIRKQEREMRKMYDELKFENENQMRSFRVTTSKYEMQISDLESRLKSEMEHVCELKDSICVLQSEVKGGRMEGEERFSAEKSRHDEMLRNLEQEHNRELTKSRFESQQEQNELREKLMVLEKLKGECEVELNTVNLTLANERSSMLSQIQALKHKMKMEQTDKVREMSQKLQAAEDSCTDAEERLRAQAASHAALGSANTRLTTQVNSLTHHLSQLQVEIDEKPSQLRAAETRVREEVRQQLEELQVHKTEQLRLASVVMQLQKELTEQEHEHQLRLRQKESETKRALHEAKRLRGELLRLREEEVHRVSQLHGAFMTYVGSSLGRDNEGRDS